MNQKRSLTPEESRQIVALVIAMKPDIHTIINALLLGVPSSKRDRFASGGGLQDDANRSFVVATLLNQLSDHPQELKIFLENLHFQLTHNGGPSDFLNKLMPEL